MRFNLTHIELVYAKYNSAWFEVVEFLNYGPKLQVLVINQPKHVGGLGFRDFKSFNLALVAKNWWRIYNYPDSLLGKVFKSVYFSSVRMECAKKGYRPSYAWSSILKTSSMIQKGSCWRIGDGSRVRIWEDNWLANGPPVKFRQDVVDELGLAKVADLMLPDNGGWNVPLLEWTFCPATAARIMSVPLPRQPESDQLFWLGTADGLYSVKTGYEFLQEVVARDSPSTSLSRGLDQTLWKRFWKEPSMPRVREVSWRVCAGALPVRTKLRQRGVDVDSSFPLCGLEEETIDHLFLGCNIARGCWFASPMGVRVDPGLTMVDFLTMVIRDMDLELALVSQSTLSFTLATSHERGNLKRWRRPAEDVVKVNVDAAVGQDRFAGFGLVARDHAGEVLAAAAKYPTMVLSPTVAEALSLRWSMDLAIQLGFRRVQFETDCLLLQQAWKKVSRNSYLFSIIKDCHKLVVFFDHVDLTFVRREGNFCADYLARNASSYPDSVWIEEGPPGLSSFLRDDVLASMPISI
ncbi:uncharacterized protein LOC130710823 [Lotus japonicus]|uniref:uncharacterized protein LOC130710823 n=1 Tax=Lotus japonicus TaxID=34305 RepID=UPI002585CAD1|nr:uncharacterized protein LOC130710823 [Lotus japonicus]